MPDLSLERRPPGRAVAGDEPGAEDETHRVCFERARRVLGPAGWRIDEIARPADQP